MTKKIGVCACYNTKNYGSMLQSLATGIVLENLGYEYEFIRYTRKMTIRFAMRSFGRIPDFVSGKIRLKKMATEIASYPEIAEGIKIRNQCFDTFMNDAFTHLSPVYETIEDVTRAACSYDAVLVGSDQLWNPVGYSTGFYNLMFVPDNVLKVSYATSFGVSDIPDNKKKIAKQFLNRIDYISVRELRASEIVKELTGRDVPTVVDPTLLFTTDDWKNIIPKDNVVKGAYIFCYLLGSNCEHRKWVNRLKKETGLKIVTIPHLDEFVKEDISFGDVHLYNVGPAEFVNLIRNATYICTDSFHGSVFSILSHKQFVTFDRFSDKNKNSRNSRIDSLLKQTHLEERRVKNPLSMDYEIITLPIDFDIAENSLMRMRKTSIGYLKESLAHMQ